ncbi:glycosyltransferase family 2 protein [Pseudocnuella soli]|uniref:glycosyltransferase family 2 protein n=1 Tax=Pseudocnuella soli TaxID=2502779 RepID=UPI0010441F75|nr:glycosyltransferase [Pseudocnuella soli]
MKLQEPLVSVLVPTYNSAAFLEEAIESVLAQTYTNFELLIVDNQSTDNTKELVQQYLSDPRVQYQLNEKNLGMVGNFNRCLELAQGKYLKFLMSDDKFHPEILEKFVGVMEAHPNVSLVTSDRGIFGAVNYTWVLPFHHLQAGKMVIADNLKSVNWLGEPTTVMIRKANMFVGPFNPEFHYLTDWDMWLRHLAVGDCYIVPGVYSYFRIHANQSTKQIMQNIGNYIEEYRFYKNIQKHNKLQLDLQEIKMDRLVSVKALFCSKVIIKGVLSRKLKKNWKLMAQAFQIIRKEHVPLHLYLKLFSKKRLSEIY